MYPRIVINKAGLYRNAAQLKHLCDEQGVELQAVVKALAAERELIFGLAELGISSFGDALLDNLAQYPDLPGEKWLIRLPMLSETEQLVQLSDGCLVSEEASLLALNAAAQARHKPYQVLLMAELGDLREGCQSEELLHLAQVAESLPWLELRGLGANLSCYGEILPDEQNMAELARLTAAVEAQLGRSLRTVSGGNSSSWLMLAQGQLPRCVNQLRMGESWLLGHIPCHDQMIPGYQQHNFRVEAEITELKTKPSQPYGQQGGQDSFGGHSEFPDKGLRRRALLAIGKQDLYIQGLQPADPGVTILGGSSNCLICDISDSQQHYQLGQCLTFYCDYAATASAMVAPHLQKVIE